MLDYITVKNYKAFDEAVIPVKPITILLGANSVGKSALIQLMLMLQQTAKEGFTSYKSALKLFGGYVNVGDARNLFRKNDTSKPLEIGFTFKSDILKSFLEKDLKKTFLEVFRDLPFFLPLKGFSEIRKKPILRKVDFENYFNTIISVISKESTKEKYVKEIQWLLQNRYNSVFPPITEENKQQFIKVYDFISKLSEIIKSNVFKVKYTLKYKEKYLSISGIDVYHGDCKLLCLSSNKSSSIKITSDLLKLNTIDLEQIRNSFDASSIIFDSFTEFKSKAGSDFSLISRIIVQIFILLQKELRKEFAEESINYVSPLRAHPKRYYMLDKAKLNITLDTLDGDAVAEVLKDNTSIKRKVNTWLSKFGIQVDVVEFKEVIHHLKVKQNNLNLDITDVGFGISQILPVIIQGFLSSNKSTTIIEQPEIHLHPKMQAELADLFIDITKNLNQKKLLIETHSEYLLKRLRRRISEGGISSDKVSICLINPQTDSKGAQITDLQIEQKGFFEWPIEFYGGELFKDTTEFLINQQ
jgi:predicted ATPase